MKVLCSLSTMAWNKLRLLGNILIIVLFLLIPSVLNESVSHERKCSNQLKTSGYTDPPGDINIKYGDPLNITCVLDDSYVKQHGANSSRNLYFEMNGKSLPVEMIERINDSSVRLYIEKPALQSNYYYCRLKDANTNLVCMNYVVVGTKPQPVDDFACISQNFENLTCTWTHPPNQFVTTYELLYHFPHRGARLTINKCPKVEKDEKLGKMKCFLDIGTQPHYRPAQRTYFFNLTATNIFGTFQLNKIFSHFQNVLSGPPDNLTAINVTTDSVLLHWTAPLTMQTFPPGLQHRVLYQSEYGNKQWEFGGTIETLTEKSMKNIYFNLTGLPYAHALYDIRISSRSNASLPYDESMWSKNSSITVRTMSKVPGAPPKTTTGSFEIVSSGGNIMYREVYVYWQQIDEKIKNGENFAYNVSVDGETKSIIRPVEITNAYAKFQNLSVDEDYTFLIWSQNSAGYSVNKSVIVVPKLLERMGEPLSFTKIAFGDGKFELTWEPPKEKANQAPVENYTIFWCVNERDRPYQCKGYLQWVTIPSTDTVYNITVSDDTIYQFAISANGYQTSSGMVWASCTVIHNQAIGKIKNVWFNHVGSTSIELGWKLDCSDQIGSVEGFVIYYCPIVSPRESSCKGPQQNETFYGDPTVGRGTITGLTPYTTYMLTVSAITKHTSQSQQSDPVYNTTLESSPSSPPLNVSVTKVSNSSITVTWSPPSAINGVLKYYEITYNNNTIEVDPKTESKVITNLTSYQVYHVYMRACTIACSTKSPELSNRTDAGYPGKIAQPSVSFQNDSYIVVVWQKPLQPRGKNDLYEIQFKEKLQYQNRTLPIINVTDTRHIIENCGNDDKYNTFYISVRAINIINGMHFDGPWSEELESYCRAPPKLILWVLAPISIIVVLGLFYLAKKMYIHYQRMTDVGVKLPAGLAPLQTDWTEQNGKEEQNHHSSADEETIKLVKLSDSRHLSGDSSGCSSGHESVTSSLESSTQLSSTSDSGTEQPRSSSSEELRKNSLRLRNVASARPPNNKCYVTADNIVAPTWSTKSVPSGSYCVLGVDTPAADANSGFLSIIVPQPESTKLPYISSDISPPSSPYVVTGELSKPVESGYVPFANTESLEKNPAYVVAGNKGANVVSDLMRLDSLKSAPIDEKPTYVQVADTSNAVLKPGTDGFSWHHPTENPLNKVGYVSIGDAHTPCTAAETKGYVPHRHFEAKSLKED